jgi:CheY-like chemotaxis protein
LVDEITRLLLVSISKKAFLKYNLAENLPDIEADPTQVRQVIMNLITNASEAIGDESGVITLTTGTMQLDPRYPTVVFADEHEAEDSYVYLEVSDTGVGMDSGTQKKVFEPFFSTKETGRGLGLSAVLGIVRGHKGAIKITSESGQGTTIRVLFPSLQSTTSALGEESPPAEPWSGKGLILVVDDEEDVRDVAREMLERLGLTVLTAEDGKEAVQIYRENAEDISVVLLDLTMPKMDGAEAFEQLRRFDSEVTVVLMSGYNEQNVTNRFSDKGPAAFIHKPFRPLELIGELRKLLPPEDDHM